MRGMRGGGFRGPGRPMFRPGRPLLRPRRGWWPRFWGLGCLLYPVLGLGGLFLLTLMRFIVR